MDVDAGCCWRCTPAGTRILDRRHFQRGPRSCARGRPGWPASNRWRWLGSGDARCRHRTLRAYCNKLWRPAGLLAGCPMRRPMANRLVLHAWPSHGPLGERASGLRRATGARRRPALWLPASAGLGACGRLVRTRTLAHKCGARIEIESQRSVGPCRVADDHGYAGRIVDSGGWSLQQLQRRSPRTSTVARRG